MTTDPVRAEITEKQPILRLAEECFFGPKMRFSPPKKHPKFAKRLIFILEDGTFLFAQLFLVVARTKSLSQKALEPQGP